MERKQIDKMQAFRDIFYCECNGWEYITEVGGDKNNCRHISIYPKGAAGPFYTVSGNFAIDTVKWYEATSEEKAWLNACIEADTCVPRESILETYEIF